MAKMPQTVTNSGARGTQIIKSQGPDRGSLNKAAPATQLGEKMGGSRSNLDHSIKC